MSNRLLRRIEGAVNQAPFIELTHGAYTSVPHIGSGGQEVHFISDTPDADLREADDYTSITLNTGYTEPLNAVLVEEDDYPRLFDAYGQLLRKRNSRSDIDVAGTIRHEYEHGEVFRALGARTVFYGMSFGRVRVPDGRVGLLMGPYTIGPDTKTIKLGGAAIYGGPQDPSRGDIKGLENLGYTLPELNMKVRLHNVLGKAPFIPPPKSNPVRFNDHPRF